MGFKDKFRETLLERLAEGEHTPSAANARWLSKTTGLCGWKALISQDGHFSIFIEIQGRCYVHKQIHHCNTLHQRLITDSNAPSSKEAIITTAEIHGRYQYKEWKEFKLVFLGPCCDSRSRGDRLTSCVHHQLGFMPPLRTLAEIKTPEIYMQRR